MTRKTRDFRIEPPPALDACAPNDHWQGGRDPGRPTSAPGARAIRAADDSVFALDGRCPHTGGPLSQGIVHGRAVTCPPHDWVIDLASGESQAPDIGCVKRTPMRVEGDRILLGLPS